MILDIEGAVKFHGHSCPGLAIGIRAAEIALRETPRLQALEGRV
jgi:formylmethanofuran dehydrogenase subunit E